MSDQTHGPLGLPVSGPLPEDQLQPKAMEALLRGGNWINRFAIVATRDSGWDWYRYYLKFPCPHCNADVGEVCTTARGQMSSPHSKRSKAARRALVVALSEGATLKELGMVAPMSVAHFIFRHGPRKGLYACDANPQVYPRQTFENWPHVTCPDCLDKRPEGVQDPRTAEGWPSTPVWRCAENDTCEMVWAQDEPPAFCPECEFTLYHSVTKQGKPWTSPPPEAAGFTLREARDAENLFNCDIEVYIPTPLPFEVVQLSTLPQSKWVGLPVFHPFGQMGDLANWFRYDIGVVTEVFPDPDFDDMLRCRFVMGDLGSGAGTLAYGPDNLWVPKQLAEAL